MNKATNIPVSIYNEIRKRLTDSTSYSYEQMEYFIANTIQGVGLVISKQTEKYLAFYIQADNKLAQVDGVYSDDHRLLWQKILCR